MNFLANLILYFHFLFVLGVILPVPLILIGGLRGWGWTRKRWFRILHCSMIGIVVAEALFGIACPLTVWEERLREGTGERYGGSFIAYWVSRVLFHDYPTWVFTLIYVGFAAMVGALYWKFPPRR